MPDPTERARLGRSGVSVTRMGLGLAPIANLYSDVADTDARATIDRAWELGIRFFDTAPFYGLGLSERRTGAAIAGRDRDQLVVSTKVGRLLRDGQAVFDFSASGARRSLRDSLERLGLDRVDILHIHDPDDHYDAAVTGTYEALAELRAAGIIRAVSVGMNQAAMLDRFVLAGDFDAVLLAGRYTLLEQSGLDDLFPHCQQRGTSVIAAGVYNSGLLASPGDGAMYNYAPAPPELIKRALELEDFCARRGVPLKAAAVQFPLAQPAVATVLVGARTAAEVEENLRMFSYPIPAGFWSELKSAGLLPAHVPTP
jgi:D-threo-aldose 1-dehydrogenase